MVSSVVIVCAVCYVLIVIVFYTGRYGSVDAWFAASIILPDCPREYAS